MPPMQPRPRGEGEGEGEGGRIRGLVEGEATRDALLGPRRALSTQLLDDVDEGARVDAHLAELDEDRERVLVEPRVEQPRDLVQHVEGLRRTLVATGHGNAGDKAAPSRRFWSRPRR
eukprot:CAMPEP_0182572286 /NCGR_PEP_ID=MMETSP1324-20130603/15915_1 /TAXON_ID=236786 /ORGANISM="Florenciella sp., Strain RCC1587" /LENGTH=116 /DNA_ID=CAMNT_0024787135 /DNA_START=67 /DNA_END=413 /DNA_ORIENTATION=-